jgi:hypothetical protein
MSTRRESALGHGSQPPRCASSRCKGIFKGGRHEIACGNVEPGSCEPFRFLGEEEYQVSCGGGCRRLLQIGAAIIVVAAVAFSAQAEDSYVDAARSALGWHYRWNAPLAEGVSEVWCRGECDEGSRYYLYCEPGPVSISFRSEQDGRFPSVQYVGRASDDYSIALRSHRELREPGVTDVEEIGFRLSVSSFDRYAIDPALSTKYMDVVLPEVEAYVTAILRQDPAMSLKALFPLVRNGDPRYHVYILEADKIHSVFEFTVTSGEVADFPHWTYDRPHKNIPRVASSAAKDESRWLREVTFNQPMKLGE